MYNNPFLKKDPLLEAVKGAMQDGETRRQAEAFVNEQFGVYSRKAVVREELAAYDAALEEAYGALKEGVQIDEMAHKALTAAGYKAGPKDSTTGFGRTYTKGKKSVYVDADGFAHHGSGSKATVTHGNKETAAYLNRGKKKMEEELAKKDWDKDRKIESEKDEVWGSRFRAAKAAGKLKEEEHLEEGAGKALKAAGYTAGPRDSTTGFGRTYTHPKGHSAYVDADGFAHFGSGKKSTVTHGRKETEAHLSKLKEGMADPNDPSYQGGGDVTSTPAKHVRAPNMKTLKDPRDSSYQGAGEVTSGGKPASIREEGGFFRGLFTGGNADQKSNSTQQTLQKAGQSAADAATGGVFSRIGSAIAGAGTSSASAGEKKNIREEEWEGSKKDRDEDKRLAKKHGMSLAQWEKSAADKKHDAKKTMAESILNRLRQRRIEEEQSFNAALLEAGKTVQEGIFDIWDRNVSTMKNRLGITKPESELGQSSDLTGAQAPSGVTTHSVKSMSISPKQEPKGTMRGATISPGTRRIASQPLDSYKAGRSSAPKTSNVRPAAKAAPAPQSAGTGSSASKGGYYKGTQGDYTIKKGDTLSSIAARTGQTVSDLAKMNKIGDVNKISAGAKLSTSVPTPPVRPPDLKTAAPAAAPASTAGAKPAAATPAAVPAAATPGANPSGGTGAAQKTPEALAGKQGVLDTELKTGANDEYNSKQYQDAREKAKKTQTPSGAASAGAEAVRDTVSSISNESVVSVGINRYRIL